MQTTGSPPAVLDPAAADFLADPHPIFDALRGGGGVVRDPIGWSTISYPACSSAFLDTALVPGIDPLLQQLGHGTLWGVPGRTLTDSEGEAHQRLRHAVAPWFTTRRIAQLRDLTRQLVDDQLAPYGPAAQLEVMADLVNRVPAQLFCAMVGVGAGDAPLLAQWSKALLMVFTAQASMVAPVLAAKAELATYTEDLLAHKAGSPGDDLASALADAARAGSISSTDAYCLLEELLSASVDNTANTAGLAIHTLAQRSDAWRRLHEDAALVSPAVEECGRFQPAIRHTIKYATADTTLDGQPVVAGEFVTVRVAAAHRDPDVYPNPHAFDLDRVPARPQLAFGAGRHYCLGAALGRMEVQEMVEGLTARWRTAQVRDGVVHSIAASGHVHELPLGLG